MSNVLKLKEVVKEYKKTNKALDDKLKEAEESQRQARITQTGTQSHSS